MAADLTHKRNGFIKRMDHIGGNTTGPGKTEALHRPPVSSLVVEKRSQIPIKILAMTAARRKALLRMPWARRLLALTHLLIISEAEGLEWLRPCQRPTIIQVRRH